MNLKLLPCPFCGHAAQFNQMPQDSSDNAGGHYIACSNTQCAASTNVRFSIMDDARPVLAEQWNRRKLPELNPDLIAILGRPNFTCIRIAQALRLCGVSIEPKAEHEQAAVIFFLLTRYLRHGHDWASHSDADLRAMLDQAEAKNKAAMAQTVAAPLETGEGDAHG